MLSYRLTQVALFVLVRSPEEASLARTIRTSPAQPAHAEARLCCGCPGRQRRAGRGAAPPMAHRGDPARFLGGPHDHQPPAQPSGRTSLPQVASRSEEHTSELQSPVHLVCRLLLEKEKNT